MSSIKMDEDEARRWHSARARVMWEAAKREKDRELKKQYLEEMVWHRKEGKEDDR